MVTLHYMNKRLLYAITAVALLGSLFSLHIHQTKADPAPLPSKIYAKGSIHDLIIDNGVKAYGMYHSSLIQNSSSWIINLNYLSLNGTATVEVVGGDGTLIDVKRAVTDESGSFSMQETTAVPVYVDVYATSWDLIVN